MSCFWAKICSLTTWLLDLMTYWHRIFIGSFLLKAREIVVLASETKQSLQKRFFLPHDRWSTGQLVITVSTNREFPQQIRELDSTYFRLTLSYFIFKNWERILKTVRTCLPVCKFCVPCCHLFCIYCEICILTGKNADITKLLGDRALIWE